MRMGLRCVHTRRYSWTSADPLVAAWLADDFDMQTFVLRSDRHRMHVITGSRFVWLRRLCVGRRSAALVGQLVRHGHPVAKLLSTMVLPGV